ncbi:MAG: TonB-dependent receptor plug domain-containing protein [Saprospiraceae bacterium]
MKEILITDFRKSKLSMIQEEPEIMNVDRIEKMVSLLGENDVIRLAQVQSGVLTGADGFGGLHVRGSNDGDNMILLDGVPVYNANHALGLFSVFNPSIIKNSTLYKGAFPAKYGGNIGSVLDIRTKDGNNKKIGGEGELGIVTAKALIEGPITKDNSSFIIGFRRTFLDLWKNPVSEILSNSLESKSYNYYFYDFNIKSNFKLNNKNQLYFSFYKGRDLFENNISIKSNVETDVLNQKSKSSWNWGNTLLSGQLTSQMGKRLFLTTTLYYTNFELKSFSYEANLIKSSNSYYTEGKLFDSDISDLGLKFDFDMTIKNNLFKYGYSLVSRNSQPMVYLTSDIIENIDKDIPDEDKIRFNIEPFVNKTIENRIYFEDKFTLKDYLNIYAGFHFSVISTDGVNYITPEPRVKVEAILGEYSKIMASCSKMTQAIHSLSNNTLEYTADIRVPSTNILEPEHIWNYDLSYQIDISKNLNYSITSYYKTAINTISYKEGSYFIISNDSEWQSLIPIGRAKMYGVENQIELNSKKIKSWFNYTYSKSKRKFENLNHGKWYDDRFSRTHMFNLITFYKITDKTNLFVDFVYGSGNPYTLPVQLTPDGQLIYDEVNNWKLPAYKRMDIGVEILLNNEKFQQNINISFYNILSVFGTKNPLYVTFSNIDNTLSIDNFKYVYVFPFIPSFSYKFKF